MEDATHIGTVPIVRLTKGELVRTEDVVTIEEPLEIFIDDEQFYMTMRMPGEEIPLALGICFTDGIIDSMDDVAGANYCSDVSRNKINIYLSPAKKKAGSLKQRQRRFPAYSSCGICGTDMIEEFSNPLARIGQTITMDISRIAAMQRIAQEKQEVFPATGGTHAAAIFSAAGELLSSSEDVGRHNALDKAIGKLLFSRAVSKAAVVILTSRLSFEMVQKTVRLGAEILCGASPPTTLAIELADKTGLTLIGFFRGDRGNIYAHPERIWT